MSPRRQFDPDLGIEGPFIASKPRRAWRWLRGFLSALALVWAGSFIAGVLLRHWGLV